jgi:hypothetical protein
LMKVNATTAANVSMSALLEHYTKTRSNYENKIHIG